LHPWFLVFFRQHIWSSLEMWQELSYRKQIARKLRTQYVEGIHRPKYYTVNLKSRLKVTHWKWNHWTDIGLRDLLLVELFDVKYCDLEMWIRGHSRSLKVVPFESLRTVSYSPSIVTMAVSVAILEIFSVKKWPDLEIWVWFIENGAIRQTMYDFLLVHCNYIALSCTICKLFDVE